HKCGIDGMKLWIIPGAPLPEGRGWRVWCSQKGENEFSPPSVEVRHHQASVPSRNDWNLLPPIPGVGRRMGILILTLNVSGPPEGALYELTFSFHQQSQIFNWWT